MRQNRRFVGLCGFAFLSGLVAAPASLWAQAENPKPPARTAEPETRPDADKPVAAEPARPAMTEHTRAQIHDVMDSLQKAALAGDGDGWVRLIARGDTCYLNEQKYFARDLKKNIPARFALEIGEGDTEEDAAWCKIPLTMRWTMKNKDGELASEREVSFPARFVKEDGQWRYAGEAWKKVEGDHVVVFYDGELEQSAKSIAGVFPDIREKVQVTFGLTVDHVQQIKLYTKMKHLQASIMLSYVDGLSGWNEPGEPIKQMASRSTTGQRSKGVLAHEFGHVCTFEMGPKANDMPWWVLEGTAEAAGEAYAGKGRKDTLDTVSRWAAKGQLRAWKDLAVFGEVKGSDQRAVYTQGHHMMGYIADTFGLDKRNAWLRAMAKGANIDDATRSELGMTFDELDQKWRGDITPWEEPKEEKPKDDKPKDDKKEEKKDEKPAQAPKKDGGSPA